MKPLLQPGERPVSAILGDPGFWGVLAVAIGLRAIAVSGVTMWVDEAQFAAVVSIPSLSRMMRFLVEHESHPPGYYLIARGWLALFGDSDGAFVALPLVIGLGVVVGTYAVAVSTWSKWAGRLAGLLAATSLPMVFASSAARPYSLLGGLALLATWSAWRLISNPSPSVAVGYALLSAALVYIHHWAWLVIIAHVLLGLLVYRGLLVSRSLRAWLLSGGLILALYLPWLPALVLQVSQAGHHPPDASLVETLWRCLLFVVGLGPLAASLCAVGLLAVLVAGRGREGRRSDCPDSHAGAVLFWVATPILVLALAWAFLPFANLLVRHAFATVAPLLCIGLGGFLDRERSKWHWVPAIAGGVLVSVSGFHTLGYARLDRSTVRYLAERIASADANRRSLVLLPLNIAPSFLRYYRGKGEVRTFPDEAPMSPVEFDNRMLRDTSSGGTLSVLARIEQAAAHGEAVWHLEGGMPSHMYPVSSQIGRGITGWYGDPSVAGLGSERRAAFEYVTADLYLPRP